MPVSIPPTNTTPATAYVLNGHVPLDATIDLRGLANPQRVWFKYTLGANEFGWAAYATGDAGFRATITYRYEDPLGAPFQSGHDYPVEGFIEDAVGVAKIGAIYISLENGYLGAGYVPLFVTNLSIQVSENAASPSGSLIINNDVDGHPLTIVNPTGEPTQLRSFVAGESAANLENGLSLWSDATDTTKLHLYDANLVRLTTITWPRGHLRSPVAGNRLDTFYAASRNLSPGKIVAISSAGVLGTEWSIANVTYTTANYYHLAPSRIDSDLIYCYVSFVPAVAGYFGLSPFHKSTQTLDPITVDADDPDYNVGGFYGNEFLVLPDDSFLVMFRGDTDSKVKLFTSSGVWVRDFVIPAASVNRISYDGATYTSFWTWSFTHDTFDSRFIRFRIIDGAILEDFTLPTTSAGNGFSSVPGGASDSLFGVPECCPLLTPPTTIPPYGPPGTPPPGPPVETPPTVAPSYFEDPRIIRRLRRAPHLAQENVRVFYRTFELDLERGVGLSAGQGSDPLVMLRVSRDGGHTWGEPQTMRAGRLGAFTQRVIARRLGSARDMVFEVTVSDPVAWSVVQAWLDLEAGTS